MTRLILILAGLLAVLALVACGEMTPAQQTESAIAEQTKTWEKAKDKAHSGWDEDERIDGEHCENADDDVHPAFQLAEMIKAEIEHSETFDAVLGKKDAERAIPNFSVRSLGGSDIRKFDIQMSEFDIENIKAGGRFTPLMNDGFIPSEHSGVWTDRPKHYGEFDFRTESNPDDPLSRYQYWTAQVFIDHWTCEVKLLDIVPNT